MDLEAHFKRKSAPVSKGSRSPFRRGYEVPGRWWWGRKGSEAGCFVMEDVAEMAFIRSYTAIIAVVAHRLIEAVPDRYKLQESGIDKLAKIINGEE